MFESDHQLFEIICSAATADEEEQWRGNLERLSAKAIQNYADAPPSTPEEYSYVYMDLKPGGYALGQPGTLARRLSVQRAATIGPRGNFCQVVIKDTTAPKTDAEASSSGHTRFGRSRSLLSSMGRIPVLCPRRSDRARIEHDMAAVWTREALPYPVMRLPPREHHIRASASSAMRKLSRSSIASSLSKRSYHRNHVVADSPNELREGAGEEDESARSKTPTTDAPVPPRPTSRSQFSIVTQIQQRKAKRSMSRVGQEAEASPADIGGPQERDGPAQSSGEACERLTKSRWSSPAAILGSFSAEGFRGLFT